MRDVLVPLVNDLLQVISTGTDNGGVGRLSRHAATLSALSGQHAELKPLAEDAQKTMAAEADEAPLPMLDFVQGVMQARPALAEFHAGTGEVKEIPEGGYWSTPMAAEILYTLIPETRPFAKRAKAPEQIENIEAAGRRGQVADLRLVQTFLKMLTEKVGNTVADVAARIAVPAYGPVILNDLWPTLAPENRTFIAAYKIDVETTLARLLDKAEANLGDGDVLNQTNMAFHRCIAIASGNAVFRQLLEVMTSLFTREQRAILDIQNARIADHRQHVGIYEALRARDAEGAGELMRRHLEKVRGDLEQWDPTTNPIR